MKKLVLLLMMSILLGISVLAYAQEDEPMNDLPPADEHMQQFEWFIGEWNVKSRMLMNSETDEWLEEDLHTVHTYEMGGHLIFEHFFGPLGGEPFEGWSLRRYNPAKERWEQRWTDTSSGAFASWVGNFNEAGDEFTGYAERFLNEEGTLAGTDGYREVFFNITPEAFSWRYETTSDGGATWTVAWTLEYTRKM